MRIGTRDSELAMRQTEIFVEMLKDRFPGIEVEVVPMKTTGDLDLKSSLDSLQGFGAFVRELDAELLAGRIDVSVNSMKDMPIDIPEGLCVPAVLPRADVRDVMLPCGLDGLEEGAVVGTSSIRRMAELKAVRPDLRTENLRGNVRTRLSKLDNGDYDAIILAKAGLDRLGVERGMAVLDPALFTPAPAQGAIAVACRADDASTLEVLSQLDDAVTRRETDAERRIMGLLGAGCSSPVGINARLDGDIMHIDAVNFDFEEGHQRVTVDIPSDHSDEYLQKIAWRLLRKGHVYLVGSGPGDPGLMTVKSMELLRLADTVVYDALANHDVLTECKGAELIDVGKRSNNHKKTQAEINEILVEHGRKGEFVVRLKGGDPFLFGRGSEEAEALRKADVDVTVVPGVSSSISVPELAGIPVTARGISSVVTIVTGHEMDDKKNPLDWSMLAAGVGTIVILMGMERAGRIAERLISSGMSPDTRVAVVSEGSRSSQRTGVSVLSDLEGMIAREGLKAPGIIVIGDVVSQRGILGDLS